MIKQTFGITKTPFLQSNLTLLPHQQEVADIINIHAQHGGCCVITGDPGVGKTVLIKHLEKQSREKDQVFVSFSRTMDTYTKIVQQIATALELEPKVKKIETDIIAFVSEKARSNRHLVTIIDEAHLLHHDCLRKLRLLFDRFPKRHNLILMGQPDLMIRLALKHNEDIRTRITYSKQLKPLNDDDLLQFIIQECDSVKLPKTTYEDGALDLILRSVKGNLRLCNNLCHAALLEACRRGERIVDHTHVVDSQHIIEKSATFHQIYDR